MCTLHTPPINKPSSPHIKSIGKRVRPPASSIDFAALKMLTRGLFIYVFFRGLIQGAHLNFFLQNLMLGCGGNVGAPDVRFY
jgi:hypothetical protein